MRGYIQSVVLNRDAAQAKVLAYTVESIRKRVPSCEFTAVTEAAPITGNLQQLFISKLFEDQNIRIVPIEPRGNVRGRTKNEVAIAARKSADRVQLL